MFEKTVSEQMNKYPSLCQRCGNQFSTFHAESHPDDGKVFSCSLMVESMNDGSKVTSCAHFISCSECIVTRPACGGCWPIVDAEESNRALEIVARLKAVRS